MTATETAPLRMSVGRDYRAYGYEYVIYGGDPNDPTIVCRQGGFKSSATARRAGHKAAEAL